MSTLNSQIKLGIVCPMANEKDTVEEFVQDVFLHCKDYANVLMFTVLDNKSKDGTVDLLREMAKKDLRIKVVWAPENRCVVDAYIRGYKEAIAAQCDWILEIDAGYSHQPSDIPRILQTMAQGYDCVFGSRFCKGGRCTDMPLKRYIISYGGSKLINLLLGTKLSDMTSGFELFSRDALKDVLEKGIHSRAHFFQTEIKVHCRKRKITEVPIHYHNPSNNVNGSVLDDAFKNLGRLVRQRIKGVL